ncbi:MAG TPA: NUDIX domain-containing protein [Coleofasciculaceae cyanobacterium]
MTPAKLIAQFAPLGEQAEIEKAIATKLNPTDSRMVQRAIIVALASPSVEVALVKISSPLGLLWQSHSICKSTGERVERNYPNLSETVEDETPLAAALRGIQEELGLEIERDRLTYQGRRIEVRQSKTEARLKRYLLHIFSLQLTQQEATAAILEADEGDHTIFFEWR